MFSLLDHIVMINAAVFHHVMSRTNVQDILIFISACKSNDLLYNLFHDTSGSLEISVKNTKT